MDVAAINLAELSLAAVCVRVESWTGPIVNQASLLLLRDFARLLNCRLDQLCLGDDEDGVRVEHEDEGGRRDLD
jgi:hypothetical protein